MIIVHYGEYPCDHFRKEISKADFDLASHKHAGEILRLTGSEHYIRRLLQAVRCGKLRTDEVAFHCGDRTVAVDAKGEFITPWPDDLFEAAFHLQFHEL